MATLLPYALTTVEDVKETLGIASSDHSKDNLIIRKINQATTMIESYTGRRFALTTYTNEEYDATGTNQLVLKHYPVVSLDGFGTRESSQNLDDWDDTDTELYFMDKSAGVIDLNFGTGRGWNRLRVSYTAGFAEIPSDIAEAAAAVAAYMYDTSPANTGSASGSSIKSKSEGGRKVEYYDSSLSSSSGGGSSSSAVFERLGIVDTLNNYSMLPVSADK